MLQWFLRFSEFAEFTEFNESYALFRENSNAAETFVFGAIHFALKFLISFFFFSATLKRDFSCRRMLKQKKTMVI